MVGGDGGVDTPNTGPHGHCIPLLGLEALATLGALGLMTGCRWKVGMGQGSAQAWILQQTDCHYQSDVWYTAVKPR
jgi:hypothetical protein